MLSFCLLFGFVFFVSSCQNKFSKEKGMITLWPNGPFIKYEHNPILQPTSGFESKSVYNPAVIVNDGKFSMLYRAEGEDTGTGAIGLAFSKDGIHFERYSNNPVMVREYDYEKEGVEDPRLVKFGETYFLTYTGTGIQTSTLCLATSTDLIKWEKKGKILPPRNGTWNSHQIKAGAIVPEKINSKYVMYFQGEMEAWKARVGIAYSDDLMYWYEPLHEPIMRPRSSYFDSMGVEPGAVVVIEEGILLIYNGWNEEHVHKTGWVIFSKDDPKKILARCEEPILESKEDWEGHILFTESIVEYEGNWYLHYGIMDKFIGVATYRGSIADLNKKP